MRVFMTGASGWIGTAVAPMLVETGHSVVGLARSDEAAAAVAGAGADVRRGAIEDLDVLGEEAAAADGVIHLAFIHDFSSLEAMAASAEADRMAIEALGAALEGSGKPLLIASGLLGLEAEGAVATERAPAQPSPRGRNAALTVSLADRGVRSAVVRLPPTVHGRGDAGFVPMLIAIARDHGVSAYIADGATRWSAVHRLDAARVFALGLERAAPGSVLHAAADEGIPTREIAGAIGRHLAVPVTSVAPEAALEHLGFMAFVLQMDGAASSTWTREALGWEPTEVGLLEDLELGHYFEATADAITS